MYPSFRSELLIIYFFIGYSINGVLSATYIGCFKEKSVQDRLFKGDYVNFRNTLTPDKCIKYCKNNGFAYAGLQYKYECFCSKERPTHKSVANEGECNMKCDGNSAEICGGGQRLSVYSTASEGNARYIGCYKERSVEARLLPEDYRVFRDILTPARCIAYCKEKRYDYAGLEYSNECFCSNMRPSFKSSADENDCNVACAGDENLVCGGNNRLSVYETTDMQTNFVQSNYVGCYADNSDRRSLGSKYGQFQNLLTPEICVGFCYRSGYRFAGVQNSTQCFCGDHYIEDRKVRDSECNQNCANSRLSCGGLLRNAIYHTQISDYSEDGRLEGCFIDNSELRVLSAVRMTFEETNTPKLCFNVCMQLGYKYSGVEYGNECFCGNRSPARDLEVGENHCGMPCPGNRIQHCGGSLRILVHSTSGYQDTRPEVTTPSRPITQRPVPTTTKRSVQTPRPNVQPITQRVTQRTTQRPNQQNNQRPPYQTTTSVYSPVMLTSTSGNGDRTTNRNNGNSNTLNSVRNCVKSVTEIEHKTICKGDLLFKDNFENTISPDKWTYEVKMPWIPDYEFVVLQKKTQNAFVKNGKLHIKPTLMEDEFVRKGRLELQSCTGMLHSEECVRQAATFSILPPIESARITTKETLSFKYGIIQVRAKLPLGDWIVPEIWLEPKRKFYGPSYASGRIRIAMARGNKNLMYGDTEMGNRKLESSVLMGVGENIRGRTIIRDKIDGWHKHFHNYTLIWTPDNLKFLVDGQHEETIMTPETNRLAEIVEFDDNTLITWKTGTKIAPFDQEFYLSLGLTVGGMRDFPDESYSSGHEKPWRNMAVKAMINFWQDRHHWRNTWDDERSVLQVEHVRIQAL
ncbi:hypothetical protein O3M35_009603 [Rhynocoris fuscipes]|uniref:Uncharacterized protein n=1 Tax=Rhynocoris fuscipes TaxID=488301 RepID=A0AAW1D9G1_9HEMI